MSHTPYRSLLLPISFDTDPVPAAVVHHVTFYSPTFVLQHFQTSISIYLAQKLEKRKLNESNGAVAAKKVAIERCDDDNNNHKHSLVGAYDESDEDEEEEEKVIVDVADQKKREFDRSRSCPYLDTINRFVVVIANACTFVCLYDH